MNHARRAATRSPLHHLRSAFSTATPSRAHAARAFEDPLDPVAPTRTRRVAQFAVPGIAAVMAVSGTAFAVMGSGNTEEMEAVPAAAALPERNTDQVSRSSERPTPAAQTPSADAMATATEVAAPVEAEPAVESEAAPVTAPQQLEASSFTPAPKPSATTASAKAAASSSPTASSSASSSDSASASTGSSSSAASTGNCPSPTGYLAANAQKVYQASCANFPFVTSYGGARPGDAGNHGTGHAVDIMVSGSNGQAVANYMRANAASLGVTEVIYQQQIWTTQRASEGWRAMSDRGSAAANHMDHVHVSVS